MTPTVSVIIAVLNGAKTVGKAIGSAQGQSIQDIEIIVVDDGSTDGTFEYITTLSEQDPRIVPVRLPQNLGPSGARNVGFQQAKGTWLAILDADDWMEPNRFEVMLKAAEKAQADVVIDNMKFYDHSLNRIVNQTHFGEKDRIVSLTPTMAFELDNPYRSTSIGFTQPLFRRDYLTRHNLAYNLKYRVGEDYLLLLEIILSGGKAVISPEAHYIYVHMVSPTTRKKAPQSHTKNGADQIAHACDELLEKYGSRMTLLEKQALLSRQSHFWTLYYGRQMLSAVHAKKPFRAMAITLQHPQILFLVAASFLKMIYARLSNFILFRQFSNQNP